MMATFIINSLEVTQSHGSKESGMDHVHTTVTLRNNCCIYIRVSDSFIV